MYDTYGFPVDLTALILEEKGLKYDHAAFQEELKKQQERSRSASATSTTDWVSVHQGQFEIKVLQTDTRKKYEFDPPYNGTTIQ